MSTLRSDLIRQNEIRRSRAKAARIGVLSTVAQAQLMFWAWVLGWMLGPVGMRPVELAAGALFTFAVGAAVAYPFVRRRIEAGLRGAVRVREGNKRRRIALFDGYFTIGEEIVLMTSLKTVERAGSSLTLQYERATDGQTLTRALTGHERALSRLQSDLRAPSTSDR